MRRRLKNFYWAEVAFDSLCGLGNQTGVCDIQGEGHRSAATNSSISRRASLKTLRASSKQCYGLSRTREFTGNRASESRRGAG